MSNKQYVTHINTNIKEYFENIFRKKSMSLTLSTVVWGRLAPQKMQE